MEMKVIQEINPTEYEVGVIIARFQVHELHSAHKALINHVCENHKKVIVFLGVSVIQNTKSNPLDFATRRAMIQEEYPDVIILPLKDQRSNKKWSQILDEQVKIPFGDRKTLLYGGRDSFIPYYEGKYKTAELTTDVFISGTEIRNQVSREILSSKDFRAGIIHANYAQRSVTYPTVDVIAVNDKNQILLSKKPNEDKYRIIGGFVKRGDISFENSARREFMDKTSCAISDVKYITSSSIEDWRYNKSESGILTSLFVGKFIYGRITPSDSISELRWFDIDGFNIDNIMPEHKDLMITFLEKIKNIVL
jgi:bifunctional NMN adenylyltransferase/nudix hydrolase